MLAEAQAKSQMNRTRSQQAFLRSGFLVAGYLGRSVSCFLYTGEYENENDSPHNTFLKCHSRAAG